METAIGEIAKILQNTKNRTLPRLVLFDKDEMLFFDKGATRHYVFFNRDQNESSTCPFSSPQTADRDEILSCCSELELVLNELITAFLITPRTKVYYFIDLLDRISLSGKISLLSKYKLTSKEVNKKLKKISRVRNAFAHQLVPEGVEYNGMQLQGEKSFNAFKSDYEEVIQSLMQKLKGLQPSPMEVLEKLKSLSSKN